KLLVNWYSAEIAPAHLLGEWKPALGAAIDERFALDETSFQDTINARQPGTGVTGWSVVDQSDRGCLVSGLRHWGEMAPKFSDPFVSLYQYTSFVATPNGWGVARKISPAGPDSLVGIDLISESYNPNRCEWVTLLVRRIYIDYARWFPAIRTFSTDTGGHATWNIDTAMPRIAYATSIIPIDSAEYYTVTGTLATHWRGRDSVGAFTFTNAYPNPKYRRLLGPYFLLSSFTPGNAGGVLALELYDLNGTLLRRRDVNYTGVWNEPVFVQNRVDSALAILRGDSSGVRLDMLDRLLNPGISDRPISITRGTVRHPSGVFRNDTLYAVWEDDRDGISHIYGNYLPVPRLIADAPGDASDSQNGFSLAPNPTTGATNLRMFNPGSRVVIEVGDMRGEIIRRYSSDYPDFTEGIWSLDLENLPAGIYTVTLISDGKRSTRSLIIHR
ncbi:MAG: T9SS type A sorting domain-containing protein, partial [Candidatus Kapaibacterium sp.]